MSSANSRTSVSKVRAWSASRHSCFLIATCAPVPGSVTLTTTTKREGGTAVFLAGMIFSLPGRDGGRMAPRPAYAAASCAGAAIR